MLGFFCQLPSASSCSEPGEVITGGFTVIGTWALTATSPHLDWATVDHSSKWSQVPLEGLRGRFIEFLQNPSRGHGLLFQRAAPCLDEIWIWIRDHGFLLQWFKLAFEHKIHSFSYCNRVSCLLVGFLETMRVRGGRHEKPLIKPGQQVLPSIQCLHVATRQTPAIKTLLGLLFGTPAGTGPWIWCRVWPWVGAGPQQ